MHVVSSFSLFFFLGYRRDSFFVLFFFCFFFFLFCLTRHDFFGYDFYFLINLDDCFFLGGCLPLFCFNWASFFNKGI